MKISIIVAMAENRVVGRDNQLPWYIPDDLKHFKKITTGHAVVMGRKTFESLGHALPNRRNIVMSRDRAYKAGGAEVVYSLDEALKFLAKEEEVFVIGGAELYRAFLEYADRIYLTLVHQQTKGDAYFPELNPAAFQETAREEVSFPIPHAFIVLDRIYIT